MAEESREAVEAGDVVVVSVAELRDLRKQLRELQRVLGKKTTEVEILLESESLISKKNDIALTVRLCRLIGGENRKRHI